jgi:heptosyltransferase-2
MKRILVVNVNWLGDAILTTPIFKALKENFPSAYIGVMTPERIREVFENNPYIDEVIIFDEKGKEKKFLNKIRFARALKKKGFDTAFFIHRSFTRAFICFLAGIKERIGYRRLKNLFVLTKKIKPPPASVHRQDYYLYLFEKIGIVIEDRLPRVFIKEEDRVKYRTFFKDITDKYSYVVGINPSANWSLKRWPQEKFALLSDSLIRDLNCAVFFIGTEKERQTVKSVVDNMKEKPYDFCGKTDLKELAALLENMDLFISNDSGPAHLAASLGINTLVLFGPTSIELTSPRGSRVRIIKKDINCKIPCYNLSCSDNACMKKISVEDVFLEAENILVNV